MDIPLLHTTLKDQLSILLRRLRDQHRGTSSFARRQPPIQPVLDALISTPYDMHGFILSYFSKKSSVFYEKARLPERRQAFFYQLPKPKGSKFPKGLLK